LVFSELFAEIAPMLGAIDAGTGLPKNPACPLIIAASAPGGGSQGRRLSGTALSKRAASGSNKKKQQDCGIKTMAADRAQNLQDTFLNHVRKTKTPLTIFLVNGVKLQGIVTWFDNFCLLLRRDGHSQLVYKHAISTIMPGAPIQLFEGGEDAPA
jgi:host factor-I protein